MKPAGSRRDRIRAQLADLKMPGALEALDEVLTGVDGGGMTASEAIEQLLGAQIMLRNNRRLQAAMRSSRLPGIKTLDDFDFSFQPSIKREQIDSLHELGFLEREETGLPRDRQVRHVSKIQSYPHDSLGVYELGGAITRARLNHTGRLRAGGSVLYTFAFLENL